MVRLLAACCLLVASFHGVLAQGQAVDLELLLSVDSSGSIDGDEFALQREGYARALIHPDVIRAMTSGPGKAIALAFIEWSGPGITTKVVPWTRIAGQADAEAVAAQLLAAPRTIFGGGTSLGAAIEDGAFEIENNRFEGRRKVIDISGDGFNNRGVDPEVTRKDAIARGITINGLAVDEFGGALEEYYRTSVIGGPGAFALSVSGYADFHRAILRKLLRELFITRASATGTSATRASAGPP